MIILEPFWSRHFGTSKTTGPQNLKAKNGLSTQVALPSRPRKVVGVVPSGDLLRQAEAGELLQRGAIASAKDGIRRDCEEHQRRDWLVDVTRVTGC